MEAVTNDSKTIVFLQEQKVMGKLLYTGFFSRKATILDSENREYSIHSPGFWKSSFDVSENGKAVMSFKKRWNGITRVKTFFGSGETGYIFRHKGFFKSRYVLQDKDDREMAVVRVRFKWKGFRYNFDIEINDSLKQESRHFLLVALAVFLTRDLIRKHAAGGVAAAS